MSRVRIGLITAFAVAMAACGGTTLTDENLAESAAPICETFAVGLERSNWGNAFDLDPDLGPVFGAAYSSLKGLGLTEETAPNGVALTAGMRRADDAWDAFSDALRPEVAAANTQITMLWFEADGSVFLLTAGDPIETGIDPGLLQAVWSAEKAIADAATALSLDKCVPSAGG